MKIVNLPGSANLERCFFHPGQAICWNSTLGRHTMSRHLRRYAYAILIFSLIGALCISSRCAVAEDSLSTASPATDDAAAIIGSGNQDIRIIPSIYPCSIKNGEKVTVSAVVKSTRPIKSVTANIGGLVNVELKPLVHAGMGVTKNGESVAVYEAEWIGAGLEKQIYSVAIHVTDVEGASWTDASLTFSDPAAGNSTPGTTSYPNGGLLRSGTVPFPAETRLLSAVVDTENGYAYFTANPNRLVKVQLTAGDAPPVRIGSIDLGAGYILGVIDTANGYAYFAATGNPIQIIKVGLGNGNSLPVRIGTMALDPGESAPGCAIIDPTNGYAYFGTETLPGRVVKVALGTGNDLPSRVGSLTLNSGEDRLGSAVIDQTGEYALFGTRTDPGIVVKVRLGSGNNAPTRIGAVTLDADESYLISAVIDQTNGYAYFGNAVFAARVVKVAMGAGNAMPSRVGAVALTTINGSLESAVIDVASGHAYFGSYGYFGYPGEVIKVALGTGAEPPTQIGNVQMITEEGSLVSGVIDPANGYAYFGTSDSPAKVVKVSLGVGNSAPTRTNAITLSGLADSIRALVLDAANGYAYCVSPWYFADTTGLVTKVAVGVGSSTPSIAGVLAWRYNVPVESAVIDASGGYAYVALSLPGRVRKVALGSGSSAPVYIGQGVFNVEEDYPRSAVIDAANGYAYFGTDTSPGRVVKVSLGAGNALPLRVSSVALNAGEDSLRSAVIDTTNGFAYFGTNTSPGRVVKVSLGAGDAAPARVSSVTLNAGENLLRAAAIDAPNSYAYFGTNTAPGRLVKIALGSGASAPSRIGAVTLGAGEDSILSAVIDPGNGFAYCGMGTTPGRIVRVALGSGSAAPTRAEAIILAPGEGPLPSAAIDAAAGFAYFGTAQYDAGPGGVVKIKLSQAPGQNQLDYFKANRLTLPEDGSVNDVRLYSHAATGNVRLAIYDDSEPKVLLWQSGVVSNSAANSVLSVAIGSGAPSVLNLSSGSYWMAWQVDTAANVPSYASGLPGAGFTFVQPFGSAPATLSESEITTTSESWTQYLTYSVIVSVNHWIIY